LKNQYCLKTILVFQEVSRVHFLREIKGYKPIKTNDVFLMLTHPLLVLLQLKLANFNNMQLKIEKKSVKS